MIKSAKDNGLNFSTMPNVSSPVKRWVTPMLFQKVTEVIEDYESVRTKEDIHFKGVWQPFNWKQLQALPEGQRAWSWFWVHSLTNIKVNLNDRIEFKGVLYRVMGFKDYSLNGYYEYNLVEDYQVQLEDTHEVNNQLP